MYLVRRYAVLKEVIPTIETTYGILGVPSLALLADFHNGAPEPILASLQFHSPSLICICGDIIVGHRPEGDRSPLETQENVLPFLSGCAAIAPTFMSLGNHEWMVDEKDLAAITATGVTVLDNAWRSITVDGKEVILAGLTSGYVTDYRAFRTIQPAEPRYPRREALYGIGGVRAGHKPETAWLEKFAATDPSLTHILMSHHPEYFPLVPKEIDLILSGHAHGGQLRMYNLFKREWFGLWSPGQGWWPKWTRGVYEGRLVVSPGLSNTTWIPRIGNPTEIVYIES